MEKTWVFVVPCPGFQEMHRSRADCQSPLDLEQTSLTQILLVLEQYKCLPWGNSREYGGMGRIKFGESYEIHS